MEKKTALTGAALAAIAMAAGCATMNSGKGASGAAAPAVAVNKGECYGVNSCKGKGECGGPGHSCAGQNSCKGQGWVALSKADCDAKGGRFKAQ